MIARGDTTSADMITGDDRWEKVPSELRVLLRTNLTRVANTPRRNSVDEHYKPAYKAVKAYITKKRLEEYEDERVYLEALLLAATDAHLHEDPSKFGFDRLTPDQIHEIQQTEA